MPNFFQRAIENQYFDVSMITIFALTGSVANLALSSSTPLCAIQCGAAQGGFVGVTAAWTLHCYTEIAKRFSAEPDPISTMELSPL